MPLTFKEVDQVLRIVEEYDANEVRFEYGELKLHVVRSGAESRGKAGRPVPVAAAAPAVASVSDNGGAPVPAPVQVAGEPPKSGAGAQTASSAHREGCVSVEAPMMGVFYAAPAPEAPPFVALGQKVREGTDLCIIEVMKVMNYIKAPCAGTVEEIVPRNAAMVELGGVMFWIRPD